MLYDEVGDREAFEASAVKFKQKEAKLKSYVAGKDHLHRRKDREQVVGLINEYPQKLSGNRRRIIRTGQSQLVQNPDLKILQAIMI